MKRILPKLPLFLLFILFLFGCSSDTYPSPTNEYYVNDFAEVLTPATKHIIVKEGENLYSQTENIETIGGAQIVFATFQVETIDDIAAYDKTDLFRQWKIGKNDMGILVVMFFLKDSPDTLKQVQIETGYRMEQYLTPSESGAILDYTIMAEESLQMGTCYLLNELLNVVWGEAYGDDPIVFDHQQYQDYFDSYVEDNGFWSYFGWFSIIYVFISGIPWWAKILSIAGIVLLGGVTGGVIKNVGGGGSSGGMGSKR